MKCAQYMSDDGSFDGQRHLGLLNKAPLTNGGGCTGHCTQEEVSVVVVDKGSEAVGTGVQRFENSSAQPWL